MQSAPPSQTPTATPILEMILREAVDAALDAGCEAIQRNLGVTTGDLAGMYFASGPARDQVTQIFEQYMRAEIDDGASPVERERTRSEPDRGG